MNAMEGWGAWERWRLPCLYEMLGPYKFRCASPIGFGCLFFWGGVPYLNIYNDFQHKKLKKILV